MNDPTAPRSPRDIEIGDIVTVRLPMHAPSGHEQEGFRPAVVVGDPFHAGVPRFEILVIAPFTMDRGQQWARAEHLLYPRFPAGIGNLRSPSICLLDQVRALDRRRVVRRRGRMGSHHFRQIREGLLGLIGHLPVD